MDTYPDTHQMKTHASIPFSLLYPLYPNPKPRPQTKHNRQCPILLTSPLTLSLLFILPLTASPTLLFIHPSIHLLLPPSVHANHSPYKDAYIHTIHHSIHTQCHLLISHRHIPRWRHQWRLNSNIDSSLRSTHPSIHPSFIKPCSYSSNHLFMSFRKPQSRFVIASHSIIPCLPSALFPFTKLCRSYIEIMISIIVSNPEKGRSKLTRKFV